MPQIRMDDVAALRAAVNSTSSAIFLEAMMSRVITFDKGSKRRLKQIRWKRCEVISLVVLSLIVLVLGVLLALWMVSHSSAEPIVPNVEAMP
jgi:putative flippase GtrA